MQLDACITNFIIQEWFPYREPDFYHLVTEALEPQVVDGYLEVPDKPGLGIELNEDTISKYGCIRVE